VLLGAIDVAREETESAQEVAATIERALRFVPAERLFPCTNCGMAPMRRGTAILKLRALAAGAALARNRLG
jgi:5-methyltetrahydropteroyltriglutamate--homocysteine methyltransferase